MLAWIALSLAAAQEPAWALPPIEYGTRPVDDRVARLDRAIEAGEPAPRTIDDLLAALEIPASSQTAVFSRTSFQAKWISPRRPRALYFSDDVYVGYVPSSGVVELTALDPDEGLVFYTYDRSEEAPRFVRETHRCLQCHASSRWGDLPAHIVRSVHPEANGQPRLRAGSTHVDVAAPYADRWGGWFVTGDVGGLEHLGNRTVPEGAERLAPSSESHADLNGLCDPEPYAADTSDVVALLVLEHQTHAQNAMAWAGYEARRALHYQRSLNEALGDPEGTPVASTQRRLDAAAAKVADALLFVGEPALPNRIGANSAFAREFEARGRRDAEGRSLRDLDLTTRTFRYPLSYTIDCQAFAGMPAPLKDRVWTRLRAALRGEVETALDAETRAAILEILADTRADALPSDW